MALSRRDRRAMVILGVMAAVAVGFFFLTRGAPPPEEEAIPPGAPSPAPTVTPIPSPEPRPPRFTFFSGRDPFLPLVVAPEAVGEAPAPGEEAPPGEAPVTEPSPGAEEAAVTEGGITIGGHSVRVIDIFQQEGQQFVQVEVDGETFVVSEGEEFGDNFRLESVQGACADFLFGDEPFTLCEGGERK